MDSHIHRGATPPRSITSLSRPALIGAAILATVAAFGVALYARLRIPGPGAPALSWAELTTFQFNPYLVGYIVQATLIPAALLYILSSSPLFQRAASNLAVDGDSLKLFLGLAAIQLLSLGSEVALRSVVRREPIMFNLLVVIIGSLLGGWRTGLGLGIITMLFHGTQDFIFGDAFQWLYLTEGLWNAIIKNLPQALFWNYLANMWGLSAVWAGIFTGLMAELLGRARLAPLAVFGLGAGVELGAGYLTTVNHRAPGTVFLLPSMLVTGLASAVIALVVRGIQAEMARREAQAAELALARAELRALRAQIDPHFLFNALNTIRYFVRTDPETARRLLLNLSEVFHRVLRAGEFVPLRDELDYIKAYLSLEEARLDPRLEVVWSIEDDSLLDTPVPTLIAQPIVENAVLHGITRKPEGGKVSISVKRVGEVLQLEVEDDGVGIDSSRLGTILTPPGENSENVGVGLRNVDGRLRALFGDAYRLVIDSAVGRGTRVLIKIPIAPDVRAFDGGEDEHPRS